MNRLERLKAIIFGGATVEPELATEVVNLDGVSVVQVDLHPHVPHHILMIPERFLP